MSNPDFSMSASGFKVSIFKCNSVSYTSYAVLSSETSSSVVMSPSHLCERYGAVRRLINVVPIDGYGIGMVFDDGLGMVSPSRFPCSPAAAALYNDMSLS